MGGLLPRVRGVGRAYVRERDATEREMDQNEATSRHLLYYSNNVCAVGVGSGEKQGVW